MREKNNTDKIRFVAVGLANTAIDFGILFTLTHAGMNIIVANYISTSLALVFSFFANKHFTFRVGNRNAKREFTRFLTVTLIGLWLLQPLVIWFASGLLRLLPNANIIQLIAKIAATIVSMIWNYVGYKQFVFKRQ